MWYLIMTSHPCLFPDFIACVHCKLELDSIILSLTWLPSQALRTLRLRHVWKATGTIAGTAAGTVWKAAGTVVGTVLKPY